ncbi:MAG: WG repeat-containing protein [Cytophagales bacterium]|nr:WG repeat-containing protein [Cytophagales bacterium]
MRKLFYPALLSLFLASCGGGNSEPTGDNTNNNQPPIEENQPEVVTKSETTTNTNAPLYLKCDTDASATTGTGKLCGYYSADGTEVIPKGKYADCLTDTFTVMARVYDGVDHKFVGINRQEEVLFTIYSTGIYSDTPSEGLFRIIEDDKMGFADLKGNIIVSPKYSAINAFTNGLAAFCEGCEKEYMGDEIEYINGKWGVIDKRGKEVIPAKYDDAFYFENGSAKVFLGGKEITIDKTGTEI